MDALCNISYCIFKAFDNDVSKNWTHSTAWALLLTDKIVTATKFGAFERKSRYIESFD